MLTQYLKSSFSVDSHPIEKQLEKYFSIRMTFFQEHPVYQPIFCEAVVSPPAHLKAEIQAIKQDFDSLNIKILEDLLLPLSLRPEISKSEVVDAFRQLQDFINIKYQIAGISEKEYERRDESCRKALNILLYGVLARKENENV